MEITRITKNNMDAFSELMPEDLWQEGEKLLLGAVSDDREAIACMAAGIRSGTVQIEWLYTVPHRREEGAATELIETLRALLAGTQIKVIEIVFDEDRDNLDIFLAERGFLIGPDADMYRVPICDLIYCEEMDWFLETAAFTGKVVSPTEEDHNQAMDLWKEEQRKLEEDLKQEEHKYRERVIKDQKNPAS